MKINEGIGFDIENKGVQKIEQGDINYYTDIYNPGQIKERLKIGREVEGSVGGFKIGFFTFNSTGNVSITGVGFTPKLVTFTYTDQIGGYGTGAMDGTSLFGYDVLGAPSQIQTECIYLRNSGGTAIGRAVFVSMDADGFTINKTLASTTIYVNYIAFG